MSTSSYIFEGPDPDVILRAPLRPGLDKFKDFHVHKVILSIASITFRDTFSIPQPPRHTPGDTTPDIVQVSDSANILEPFLQLIYPVDPPVIGSLWLMDGLFRLADKYATKGINTRLKKLLISPSFLRDDPIGVFAIACHNTFDEEAKLALPHTFTIDVVSQITAAVLRSMTTKTYHRLLTEHALRRKQLIGTLDGAWRSFRPGPQTPRCCCLERLEEKVHVRICGRPFLDSETLQNCFSLVEKSSGCASMLYCIKQPSRASSFLSEVMGRIQAL